jgi:N6-adenosine-specific RNA methylase IME4
MFALVIDKEFQALIPPLRPEERAGLEESILRDGCLDPIKVWRNGHDTILDGHNRHEIGRTHSIGFSVEPVKVESREHARLWIEENQLSRRNLTDDQRAMIANDVRERRSRLARSEQAKRAGKASGRSRRGWPNVSVNLSDTFEQRKRDTRAEIAREAKLSERKLRAAAELKRKCPEAAAKVRAGELSLADAIREVRRAENIKKLDAIKVRRAKRIAGLYDVIVIDPPWPMEKIERDVRPHHAGWDYPVLELPAIEELLAQTVGRHCADDCHVFLWAPQKYLLVAGAMAERIGLKYVCTFVWHKPGGFQPIGLPQYNCEFVIYLRKGSPGFVDTKAFATCFDGPRGPHSHKPEEFYQMLRRVTAGRRLDMFSRRRIRGFDGWGNEFAGLDDLTAPQGAIDVAEIEAADAEEHALESRALTASLLGRRR